LARRMTLRTIDLARRLPSSSVTLWCAPDTEQRFIRALAQRTSLPLRKQEGSDLGARMASAFRAHHAATILIGCDCPALQIEHLVRTQELLDEGYAAVFIPAEDGGYVLVALQTPQPRLFEGITWGSAGVMAQTRQRLRELGLDWTEPATLWDVDRPEDLDRLSTLPDFVARPIVRL